MYSNDFKVILLSSNTFKTIIDTLDYLNIQSSLFDKIICSDKYPLETPFNKKDVMSLIPSFYDVSLLRYTFNRR